MSLSIGIVGLPNAGKSTLFNALLKQRKATTAIHPFTTIEPNVGIIKVPDPRLKKIKKILKLKKTIPATIKFIDIAGLVKGAHKGEGLGNQFLSHIREVNAIILIFRLFANKNVSHVAGEIKPKNDIETILTELILADMKTLQKKIEEIRGKANSGDKEAMKEFDTLEKINLHLNKEILSSEVSLTKEERKVVRPLNLLTMKSILYVANISENDLPKPKISELPEIPKKVFASLVFVSAKFEEELSDLEKKEVKEYLGSIGMKRSSLDDLIRGAYSLLKLITFYTTTEDYVQAWPIKDGSTALRAAGKIHSDFAKKFIRAEVLSYKNLVEAEGIIEASKRGLIHAQGKKYLILGGDIIRFKHG
ncbi:MAG: redox-regulated ATPase YchF [Candidatus Berkelbacteria bacterium]|nr:redox-regulated ATPase YchF [Candidatus Berkelbacteria bacterium]